MIRFCHKINYKLNGWHLMIFSYDNIRFCHKMNYKLKDWYLMIFSYDK